jgi:hypothetical protein
MNLKYGIIKQILWAGDFNARLGREINPNSPDQTVDTRGRVLKEMMPVWGYDLSVHRSMSLPTPRRPFTHRHTHS